MYGVLYVIATPIGNLKDITLRALEILKEVDLIAAEDTRHTLKLLNHFEIKKPLTSYFEHNKQYKSGKIIEELKSGKNVALVSDAGTPVISDPGEMLIRECIENNIKIVSIPGACAAITALTLSGLDSKRFIFEGFLPSKLQEKKTRLSELKDYPYSIIFYEAPHKLKSTLKCMLEVLSDRKITIHRELTKKFEENLRMSLKQAVEYYNENEIKGEFVLIVEGCSLKDESNDFSDISVIEHIDMYIKSGFDSKEAIKKCAQDRNLPKREVYNAYIKSK